MAGEAKPFELHSFEEEMEARAREILRDAEAERDRMREEGRRAGYEAGLALGRAEAEREGRERTASVADALRRAVEGVEAARVKLAAEAEPDLIRLAIRVAEKIVKAEVVSGRPLASANLRRALELTARRRDVRVRVHPADLAAIEASLPELRRGLSDLGSVALEADAAVARGGCLVSTPEGSVDSDVAAQLAEIERGLLG